jgi:sugar phosphate isomerase/epimerase
VKKWSLGLIVPVQHPTPFSPFHPDRWEEALSQIAEAGYEAVEFAVTDPSGITRKRIAGALDRNALRLSSITTGQAAAQEGLSLSSANETIRRRAVERIQAHMRLVKPFDAVVIVGSLQGSDGKLPLLIESLKECAAYDQTVRLAFEPLNRYESSLANTVSDASAIVDRVGAKNLGLMFDTFHANIEEASSDAAIRKMGDRLVHVHLADSNRWVPGHGHLDFEPIWRALEDAGYLGGLVVESFPRPSREALLAVARQIRSQWTS